MSIEKLEKEIKTLKANLSNPAVPSMFHQRIKDDISKKEKELADQKGKLAEAKEVVKKIDAEKLSGLGEIKPKYIKEIGGRLALMSDKDRVIISGDDLTDLDKRVKDEIMPEYISQAQWKKILEDHYSKSTEKVKAEKKVVGKTSVVDYDCDDLIEKEKERLKKRKAAEKKRANKSEPAKQRERIEKVTATVEKSIKERIKSGKPVTKKEVESLIEMYEREIADLKKLLKTL